MRRSLGEPQECLESGQDRGEDAGQSTHRSLGRVFLEAGKDRRPDNAGEDDGGHADDVVEQSEPVS